MPIDSESVVKQLTDLLIMGGAIDMSTHIQTISRFNAMALASIDRIIGPNSVYGQSAHTVINKHGLYDYAAASILTGILEALNSDVTKGYLTSVQELVHADVFSDFLEMAHYLLSEGYKDPTAVLAGGTLEEHLRQLCQKNNIDIEYQTPDGPKPKKADTMNSELAKANVYSKLEQKNITAWLDLRNKAAHGKYLEYSKEQVALFLQGLRDFILKHPA